MQTLKFETAQGNVRVKRRRSWRFSQGGGALFLLFLLAPLFAGLVRRWPTGSATQLWAWPLFVALILFLAALAWFLSLRPLIRHGLWKISRTWYEACFGLAVLYCILALFIFVTGYTPSKYHPEPVPRSAGFILLYWAVLPLTVGGAFYVYEKYRKPESRP